MLSARVFQHNRAIAFGHEGANFGIHLGGGHLICIKFGALIVIDFGRPRVCEALFRIRIKLNVKRFARQCFGAHSKRGHPLFLSHLL